MKHLVTTNQQHEIIMNLIQLIVMRNINSQLGILRLSQSLIILCGQNQIKWI